MKVWVVYEIVRTWPNGYPEVSKEVCDVFDSEENAVHHISGRVKLDHYGMEHHEPNFERSQYVRYELDQQEIIEGRKIGSYKYYDETVSYMYECHEVK